MDDTEFFKSPTLKRKRNKASQHTLFNVSIDLQSQKVLKVYLEQKDTCVHSTRKKCDINKRGGSTFYNRWVLHSVL